MSGTLEEMITSSGSYEIMSVGLYIICIVSAIVMGIILSYAIQYKGKVSKSFAVTLALLPSVVCVVIMMVNGSIGAGIAVAGTFSLVRFRSVPGTAREITGVFIAMAIGLACGMGNVFYAAIFTIIMIIGLLVLEHSSFGEQKESNEKKVLRITIPEDLDYTEIFSDLFEAYTESYKLTMVKTINLGSMFRLTYDVLLKDPYEEKEFIDKLRVRNGNLEITCSLMPIVVSEM